MFYFRLFKGFSSLPWVVDSSASNSLMPALPQAIFEASLSRATLGKLLDLLPLHRGGRTPLPASSGSICGSVHSPFLTSGDSFLEHFELLGPWLHTSSQAALLTFALCVVSPSTASLLAPRRNLHTLLQLVPRSVSNVVCLFPLPAKCIVTILKFLVTQ